jgi:hypothetical protein
MTRHSVVQRALACIAIACVPLGASAARAQAPAPGDADVTLTVTPTDIPTNARVTITGLGVPEGNAQIRITITPPGAQPAVFVTTPDPNGHYTFVFGGTQSQGTYQVSAQLGTQGTPAKASFTAKTYLIDIDEDVADNKDLLGQDSSVVAIFKKAVDNVPTSPVKEDMEKKLDALEKITDQAPAQSQQLEKVLAPFKQLVSSHPETLPIIQPVFDHLSELGDEASKTSEQIKAEIDGSKKAGNDCDQIDEATQSLKAVPEAFGIAFEPFDFVLGFAKALGSQVVPPGVANAAANAADLAHSLNEAHEGEDAADAWKKVQTSAKTALGKNELETGLETEYGEKLANAIPASIKSSPAYKLAVQEVKKFLPQIVAGNTEPKKLFQMGTKLASDAIAFGTDQLFSSFCQRFEGEFTATMTAHFFSTTNNGNAPVDRDGTIHSTNSNLPIEWWTYSTAIKGKMTLRYPKGAEGNAVQLSGQFEGGATRFTYKEDVFYSKLFGRMIPGGIVHKVDVPPLATDNAEGGVVSSLTSPTSFYVPVTGTLVGNTITLTLQPARSDFIDSYARAHTVYAVVAPTTIGIPVWGHFSLPYTNAHFIIDHILANGNNTLDVARDGEKLVIKRNSDKTLPGNGNSATYTLDLKACNPECE